MLHYVRRSQVCCLALCGVDIEEGAFTCAIFPRTSNSRATIPLSSLRTYLPPTSADSGRCLVHLDCNKTITTGASMLDLGSTQYGNKATINIRLSSFPNCSNFLSINVISSNNVYYRSPPTLALNP